MAVMTAAIRAMRPIHRDGAQLLSALGASVLRLLRPYSSHPGLDVSAKSIVRSVSHLLGLPSCFYRAHFASAPCGTVGKGDGV